MINARLFERDFAHAAYHRLGAIERCRVGHLRETHQALLVLGRNETGRGACEADAGQRDQSAVYKECDPRGARDMAHAADVARGEACEEPVERTEESAEHTIEDARQTIGRRPMLL